MVMHGLDQSCHVFRRRELGNAVAEVENVPGVAGAVAIEHFFCFCGNYLWRGKQHARIQITLQGNFCADTTARFAQINRPVQADGVATARGNRFQPQAAALGKDDGRNPLAVFFADQPVDNALYVMQRELAISGR